LQIDGRVLRPTQTTGFGEEDVDDEEMNVEKMDDEEGVLEESPEEGSEDALSIQKLSCRLLRS
jgi:hypothetical protein